MGVYSNTEIHAAIKQGDIICKPFRKDHVSEASLDITLGYYYYQSERQNERTVYNLFDREQVERYFDGPYEAMPHQQWCDLYGLRYFKNIPLDHPIIVIKPGRRILAHTHEFV